MADNTTTTFTNALKILWSRGLRYAMYDEDPFLAYVPKSTNFIGRSKENVVMYEGIFGSSSITTARTNAGTPPLITFTYTRKKDYAVGFLDLEAFHAAKGANDGSLASLVKTTAEAAINGIACTTLHQLWGNGGGARGQIASGETTDTITLANIEDIVHFGVGMVLQTSTADGTSGAVKAGTVTVEAVDRDLGTITCTAATWDDAAGIPTVAANDYIFREGDFGGAINGVLAHCPTTTPTSGDNHLGVDRSVDPQRLAGVRVAANGADIIEVIIDAAAKHNIAGGRPQDCWVNPLTMAALAKELHGKTDFANKQTEKGVSIRALEIATGYGPIQVMQSRACPKANALLTRRDNWDLCGLGDWPHFSREHGFKFLPLDRDAVEFRLKRYGDFVCKKPVQNCIVTGLTV